MQKPALVTNPKRMEGENPLRDFATLEAVLPGHDILWVRELRRAAASRFTALGIPSQKVEAWKYTGLSALATQRFAPSEASARITADAAKAKQLAGAHVLVFEAGHFRPDLSSSEAIGGVEILPLSQALETAPDWLKAHLKAAGDAIEADAPFDSLNLAMMSDGVVIRVGEGVAVAPVIQILHLANAAGVAHHVRTVVLMEPGSQATILESWAGEIEGPAWTNAVTEVDIRDGASLTYVKVEDEADAAFHLDRTKARLSEKAVFEAFVLSTGGRLARSEVLVEHAGEFSKSVVNGVYIAHEGQHLDQVTRMDHAMPNATSDQVFKGVLSGKSRAAFQGTVLVRQDAQKTDARQANHTLLLSRQAEIDTKPELEIYADDVKCAHGATVGELDPLQLHYLKSRGIPEAAARIMLVEAFVAELADGIAREDLREHIRAGIRAAIGKEETQ